MSTRLPIYLCIGLFLHCTCLAQVVSTPPQHWKNSISIDVGLGVRSLKLSHNRPELIQQELMDTNTVQAIAASCGLSKADLSTLVIAQDPLASSVRLYQLGDSRRAYDLLTDQLRKYVSAREEGHTRAFVTEALTKQAAPPAIADPDLGVMATNRSVLLLVSRLEKEDSGTITNKAGEVLSRMVTTTTLPDGRSVTNETADICQKDEVFRWITYTLVDGEVAWRYRVKFKPDGPLDYISSQRFDAKECDPKYRQIIKDVEAEVEAEMKRAGTSGKSGSVLMFWELKEQKLKAKGIDWRSPEKLNPNFIYDRPKSILPPTLPHNSAFNTPLRFPCYLL